MGSSEVWPRLPTKQVIAKSRWDQPGQGASSLTKPTSIDPSTRLVHRTLGTPGNILLQTVSVEATFRPKEGRTEGCEVDVGDPLF